MQWENIDNTTQTRPRFARPIRWIVALLGEKIINCSYGAAQAGRQTYGHRSLYPDPITLDSADLESYIKTLLDAGVNVCPKRRREIIEEQVRNTFESEGCLVKIDEELLDTVNYLVENPQPIVGNYSESHLEIPPEVLITAMKKHQRYFPMWKTETELIPKFITISNGTDGNIEGVRHGNERVLNARLNDAEFFYSEDQKTSLAEKVDRLNTVIFHAKLGSLLNKAERLKVLVRFISTELKVSETTRHHGEQAAWLCKADLTTLMVIEFPSLQGVTGQYYARNSGEPEQVATAIAEHYQPLGADTPLPESEVGAILAIADKIDTIAGYFGIEERPTGSQDPYSLRRHALGTIRILQDRQLPLSLDAVVDKAVSLYEVDLVDDTKTSVLSFIKERLRVILQTHEYTPDLADAVLAVGDVDIIDILNRANALAEFRLTHNFEDIYNALNRVLRILPDDVTENVDNTLLSDDAEKQLYKHLQDVEPDLEDSVQKRSYSQLLKQLSELQTSIDQFFDDVLVMAKESDIRENRLALLNRIAKRIYAVADLTKLVIAGE